MRKVPFCEVVCDGRELEFIEQVLRSGWLTTATKALEFERRFAETVAARFACAVNSCTAALHLALEALGVGRGQRVFVPTMTFTATAEVIRYLDADPVFLDVEYGTGLLTPEIVVDAIRRHPDVKVLMLVHFGGQAAELTRPDRTGILDICRSRGIAVVEDAAHAFPSRWDGRMIGSFGKITCFSFYANKTITTGEGGMLVTDDEAVYQRVKTMRLHGIDRDVWDRFTSDRPSWEYDVVAPGFKYNLPDLAAAIGLAQLERADEFRRERERCARYYLRNLSNVPGLDLPKVGVELQDHAWHLFPVILNEDATVSRNQFIGILSERGIGTSVHYKPLHRMTYYRHRYGLRPEEFPDAERIWKGCVSLPIYPTLSDGDLEYICETAKQTLRGKLTAERRQAA
jgi:dTDP-4-amino-4,6-dideoxygalactose transaminase